MQTKDSQKLRSLLPGWYEDMHAGERFSGESYRAYLTELQAFIGKPFHKLESVLDFGCGPCGGLKGDSFLGHASHLVTAYDPYIEKYAKNPWDRHYSLVFSADVLEHMLVDDVGDFLRRVQASASDLAFLVIATRPAAKTLPNGDNVHLTVESADWWRGFVQGELSYYELTHAKADLLAGTVSLGLRRE